MNEVSLISVLLAPSFLSQIVSFSGTMGLFVNLLLAVGPSFLVLSQLEESPNWWKILIFFVSSIVSSIHMFRYHNEDFDDSRKPVDLLEKGLKHSSEHETASWNTDKYFWILGIFIVILSYGRLAFIELEGSFADPQNAPLINQLMLIGMLLWSLDRFKMGNHPNIIEVACMRFVSRKITMDSNGYSYQSVSESEEDHDIAKSMKLKRAPLMQRSLNILAGAWDLVSWIVPVTSLVLLVYLTVFSNDPDDFVVSSTMNMAIFSMANGVFNLFLFVLTTMKNDSAIEGWWVIFWLGQMAIQRSLEFDFMSFASSSSMSGGIALGSLASIALFGTYSIWRKEKNIVL